MKKSIKIFLSILLLHSIILTVSGEEKGGTVAGTIKYKYVNKYPAVVYIEEITGMKFDPPKKPVEMDQKGKEFIPRILPILAGTTVNFLNSDDMEHNVFSPDGEKYDLGTWGKGLKRSYTFKNSGAYTQLCSLHPEMVAYIIVVKTPFFSITDPEGNFKIPNIPPGTWKLKVWHERFKPRQLEKQYEVKIEAETETKLLIEL
ncbi:MAG: carboxypeptidase regulatory-like domain-containing protein [Acidobacteriota bacterium]